MLGIFHKGFAHRPEELKSLVSPKPKHPALFCGYEDIYCLFKGNLNSLCPLIKRYGLSPKGTNEALLVIEAYKTLRDRGPYPDDQIIKDFDGSYAFLIYDNAKPEGALFTALSSDGLVKLYWGIAVDGSAIISDEVNVVKDACGKSFAPFPTGCTFYSGGGLMSYEHPLNKMRPMPRVDSEGAMCALISKLISIVGLIVGLVLGVNLIGPITRTLSVVVVYSSSAGSTLTG